MKTFQNAVQPIAEITLAQLRVQLIRLLQPELTQNKKTIGAAAQIFISGTGKPGQRQRVGRRSWHAAGLRRQGPQHAGVGSQPGGLFQPQRLHQAAGHQMLAAFTQAPQHVNPGKLQSVAPGRTGCGGQLFARRQPEQRTLNRRPQTRRLQRHGQPNLVATGQYHRRQRTPEQLTQRQDHHLRLHRMLRRKAHALQRPADPRREFAQTHVHGNIRKLLFRAFVQAQGDQPGLTGRVLQQAQPLPRAMQGSAQAGQPARQGPSGLQSMTQYLHLRGQRIGHRHRTPVARP